MINNFKIAMSLLFLTITPLLASSDEELTSEDFIVLDRARKIHPHATVAPNHFTPEQYADLRTQGETEEGAYTLTLVNPDSFALIQPSPLRVLTSTDASVSGRTPKATSYMDTNTTPPTLVAIYELNGFYRSSSSSKFLVRSNVPIHGDDHIRTIGPVVYINVLEPLLDDKEHTLARLIGLVDGQFVRDSKGNGEFRLNHNAKSLLLIIAQQEGEDILGLSESARDARASEIYYSLLDKCHLTLKGDKNSLGIPVYERLIGGLINRIFYNAGIDISEMPTDLELAPAVLMSQFDRDHNPATKGIKYLVPFKALPSDCVIRKDISSLHAPLPRLKGLGDRSLVQLERLYQANRFTVPKKLLGDFPVEAQSSVLWTVMQLGGEVLERKTMGKITDLMATQMCKHLPGGKNLCTLLSLASKASGHSTVADAIVDTRRGRFNPLHAFKGTLTPDNLAKGVKHVGGIIPGFRLVYALVETAGKVKGHKSPVHMILTGEKTLTEDETTTHRSNLLDAGVGGTHQLIEIFVPGGSIIVAAAKGGAFLLGKRSLTHALCDRFTSTRIEVMVDDSNKGGASSSDNDL